MRHISQITQKEEREMVMWVQQAAIKYAADNGFGALSHAGWFNFYSALENAIAEEVQRAKSDGGVPR
jgi:hypothetical protein